jgi:UDP:flavonoid glycosyltransferase YjiC (YdhE family)
LRLDELAEAKKLAVDKLAGAIQAATMDPKMNARAAALGKAIRAEAGVGSAVKIIRQILGA